LIAEGALAIEMGCTARDLSETIHPHPTLGETVAFSAENYFGLATEIFRPRAASSAR
jgi:dihydrolipoamide dehydrogenase